MTRLLPLLVLPLLLSACASSVRTFDPADENRLRREFGGISASVALSDGRAVRAQSLRMDPDSTSWINRDTGGFEVVPTASVVRIARTETASEGFWRGARQGAVVGGVSGAVFFLALGSALGADGDDYLPLVAGGALIGALPVGAVGGLFGVFAPAQRRYDPVAPPDRARAGLPGPQPLGEPLGLRASGLPGLHPLP